MYRHKIEPNGVVVVISRDAETGHKSGVVVEFSLFERIESNIEDRRVEEIGEFNNLCMYLCGYIFAVEGDGII